jgi:2-polyprenyl-6-methoxyphenol hydroxylase-like FAD-dependent oxidoreductase
MTASNAKEVLIVGASFAGLSSAYWMRRLGYNVTIVEIAPRVRTGGTAVNIGGNTIDIVKRMGIFEQIRENRLHLRRWDFIDANGQVARSMALQADGEPQAEEDYEIERDVLMTILFDAVRADCDIVFGDSVEALDESECVDVTFSRGHHATYDLVLGCDGTHSRVRKLWFGEEAQFMHYLQQYFCISIVDKLLIERDTAQMFNVPGKVLMLNAYKNKTDIIFGFVSDDEIAYNYRDEAEQRRMITSTSATSAGARPRCWAKSTARPIFTSTSCARCACPHGRVAAWYWWATRHTVLRLQREEAARWPSTAPPHWETHYGQRQEIMRWRSVTMTSAFVRLSARCRPTRSELELKPLFRERRRRSGSEMQKRVRGFRAKSAGRNR